MRVGQFFGATDGSSSPSKKPTRAVEVSEDAPRRDMFEDAMPGYHEEADAEDEADKDAMHIGLAEEVMGVVDPGDGYARADDSGHRPRPPNSAPPTSSQPSTKPISSGPSRKFHGRASSTAPSASGSTARAHRARSSSASRALSESAPGAVTQTCPICSKTMVTDNDGLNAHIDFCLSREAIREAQAAPVTSVAVDGADEERKGFKPKSIADLLSGSSRKRACVCEPKGPSAKFAHR